MSDRLPPIGDSAGTGGGADFDNGTTSVLLLHQLDRQRAAMIGAVRDYELRLGRETDRIRGLEADINAECGRSGELRAVEDELRAELQQARLAREAGEAENRRRQEENDALRDTIDEIAGSRSWRITRPMRSLSRGATRLGGPAHDA